MVTEPAAFSLEPAATEEFGFLRSVPPILDGYPPLSPNSAVPGTRPAGCAQAKLLTGLNVFDEWLLQHSKCTYGVSMLQNVTKNRWAAEEGAPFLLMMR
jgi:hypothetical protein